MTYLKYTSYLYIIFAAFFIFDGIMRMQEGESYIISFAFSAVAIFMFFFRKKYQKKFEQRGKDN